MSERDELIFYIVSDKHPNVSTAEFMRIYGVKRLLDARVCDLKEYIESKKDSCTRCG